MKIRKEDALEYHRRKPKGKIEVNPTKPVSTQRDLSLAYSPGVAFPCLEIAADINKVYDYTAKDNLVAVLTNGTAVLGLGNIGPEASKPVMEGKAVLFKKFAGIDCFDIEIRANTVEEFVMVAKALEPTFGAINMEDVSAPDSFEIEQRLVKEMKIPIMHDDQHGTAIISSAALLNALIVADKRIEDLKVVVLGAGAAALACLKLYVELGVDVRKVSVFDRDGHIWQGRDNVNAYQRPYAEHHPHPLTHVEAFQDADLLLGLSAGGAVSQEMVTVMAPNPIVFALANPDPEITWEDAMSVRPDAIMATGRSDYPNQVNNALGFPYIFRGALDVRATTINEAMKIASARAIAKLAHEPVPDEVMSAYGDSRMAFGKDYLIPKPIDPRLITRISTAVAKAAMDSGVATRPIEDMVAYREKLNQFVFRTGLVMKPVFDRARAELKRVAYAEGEEENVLRAVQTVVDEGLARPILIGRPAVIEMRIQRAGLRLQAGRDFELTNIDDDPRFPDYWQHYLRKNERRGVTPSMAKAIVRSRATVIASIMVDRGEADAMICGTVGRYHSKLKHVQSVIALDSVVSSPSAMTAVANDKGVFFFLDTHVQADPTAEQIAEATLQASYRLKLFGIVPKVALLSHSNFGSHENRSAAKMRAALALIRERAPRLEVEGEMHADAALDEGIRERIFPNSLLRGRANLFVLPNLDAANIVYNMVRVMTDGVAIGPILMGVSKPVHVLTPSATVRRIVNMTALAAVEAQIRAQLGDRMATG
jgi:malate dehydrogenase (oxaloacetate-decarboxylating)(NADP+)